MDRRHALTYSNFIKVGLILALLFLAPLFYRICRDVWIFYATDLRPPSYAFDSDEPTGVNLPLDMALLFEDENGQYGYFYLTKRSRQSVAYCLVVDAPHTNLKSEGAIRLWEWILRQHIPCMISPRALSSFETYFFWIPNGYFLFNGNFQKVALVPVENAQNGFVDYAQVNWSAPGKPDY